MKKNSFLTFICACLPGFGEMYLGYMKRGVSLSAVFWLLIFISAFLNSSIFVLLLPIIWAYAFFDTFNIRNLTPEQRNNFPDAYIVSSEQIKQLSVNFPFLKKQNFYKIIGIILIFIGAYAGYNSLFSAFSGAIYERSVSVYFFLLNLPSLFIFALVIVLGIYMLGKSTKSNPANSDGDDTYFTAPIENIDQVDFFENSSESTEVTFIESTTTFPDQYENEQGE